MAYSKVVENFLRYVKIDTQSSEACTDKVPSTEKQHNLAKMLYQELSDMFNGRRLIKACDIPRLKADGIAGYNSIQVAFYN